MSGTEPGPLAQALNVPMAWLSWALASPRSGIRDDVGGVGRHAGLSVLDCTPQVRHDNLGDSAVATTSYRALFCANAASNSRGD